MARQSREIILNPNDSSTVIDQLQKEIAQLKTRKIELLDENGYPLRDYLEMGLSLFTM